MGSILSTPKPNCVLPNPPPFAFRVLELNPGKKGDKISGFVHIVDWDTRPEYDAISYAWGDAADTVPVYIDDKVVQVTKNLRSALQQLRYEDEKRYLWADAVCINQGDIPERSQQVTQMRAIYENARTVLIWLGPDNEAKQAKLAVESIQKLSAFVCEKLDCTFDDLDTRNVYLEMQTTARHILPWPDKSPMSSPEVWDALLWVFKHPYFQRVWAIQEVNAKRERVVHLGDQAVEWKLVNLVAGYINMEPAFSKQYGFSQANAYLANIVTTELPSLDKWHCMLYLVSMFISTDKRDVIYGLRGMMKLSKEAEEVLMPDYKKSLESVYRDSVEAGILTYDNTDVMLYATDFEDLKHPNWPSWVPRWDLRMDFRGPFRYGKSLPWTPAGKTKPLWMIDKEQNILCLTGFKYDKVEKVEPYKESYFGNHMLDADKGRQKLRDNWHRILRTIEDPKHGRAAPFDAKTIKAAAVAFSYGLNEISEPGDEEKLLDNFLAYLLVVLDPKDAEKYISEDLDARAEKGIARIFGKPVWDVKYCEASFFITEKGSMGCSIAILRKGDTVFVPRGTTFPFLLREADGTEGYRMRGYGYVHGLMHGEEKGGKDEVVRIH